MSSARRLYLGVVNVTLRLEPSYSLKDKRMVVRSMKDLTRGQFDVSCAELDGMDERTRAVMAFGGLATSRPRAEELTSKLVAFIERRFAGYDLYFETAVVEL